MINSDTPKTWLDNRLPCAACVKNYFTTPVFLSEGRYLGTLPALIAVTVLFMALSGFVLSLFYDPRHAYASITFIGHEVNYGWLIHSFHTSGTTMIFGAVYLALFRALYTRSYKEPGELVWLLSVGQFVLLLVVAYLGYVMADGAVAYLSLAHSMGGGLTGIAGALQAWFFGGPGGGTLVRLAVFHLILALAVIGITFLHVAAKRAVETVPAGRGRVGFHPYYTAQYFAAFAVFVLIFGILVFFAPHLGDNPMNAGAGNPLVVTTSMAPPWYLLGLTGLADTLPGTWGGIIAIVVGLGVLAGLPWLDRSNPAARPSGLYRFLTLLLALDVILLSLAVAAQPSSIGSIAAVVFTIYYFLHFIVLIPLVTAMEAE